MTHAVQALRVYRFHPSKLDPVTVFVEQYSKNASRVTVQCYSRAWTAYWGNHGSDKVEDFICGSGHEYVANNLTWGLNGLFLKSVTKREFAYLCRIVIAMQEHFRSFLVGGQQ